MCLHNFLALGKYNSQQLFDKYSLSMCVYFVCNIMSKGKEKDQYSFHDFFIKRKDAERKWMKSTEEDLFK